METTGIKNQIKNIFATNAFEVALELTRALRKEYIDEYGIKSWNGLVTYWRGQNVQPAEAVAEPETEYSQAETSEESSDEDDNLQEDTPIVDTAEITTSDETLQEVSAIEEKDTSEKEENPQEEDETVEYMLYRNQGTSLEWFGHSVNYKGLKEGDKGIFIRMNNFGVGKGEVYATAELSMKDVHAYHKCYSAIRKMRCSESKQLDLMKSVLINIGSALPKCDQPVCAKNMNKVIDFIINFNK